MNVDRMFNEDGDTKSYLSFNFTDNYTGQHASSSYQYEECTPWDNLLNDFVSFLSGVYGYDIHQYVKITDRTLKTEYEDDEDPWARLEMRFTEE